jgi:thioredoxin 1
MLAPAFKQMEFELPDVKFETIDVELNPELASDYSVTSVPTVLIFNEENLVERIVGANSKHKYMESITLANI